MSLSSSTSMPGGSSAGASALLLMPGSFWMPSNRPSTTGGLGNDTYVTDGGDTIVELTGEGTDTVRSSATFNMAGLFTENLVLTGSNAINGTGNTLNNAITGNGAANTLDGGIGTDTLMGGLGNDTFVFNTAPDPANIDQITDFDVFADTIQIDNSVFSGLINGVLDATAFASNILGEAADASDRIIYETDTGALYFDVDGTGAAARVQFALISPNMVMTNADFFVI